MSFTLATSSWNNLGPQHSFWKVAENCGYVMIMFLNYQNQFYYLCFFFDYFVLFNFIFLSFYIRNGNFSLYLVCKIRTSQFCPVRFQYISLALAHKVCQCLSFRMAHQIAPNTEQTIILATVSPWTRAASLQHCFSHYCNINEFWTQNISL